MNTIENIQWHKYQQALMNFVRKRVKDSDVAKDIVQEVIIKMYTKLDQLKDDSSITSWMYQITRHKIADHYRESHRPSEPAALEADPRNPLNECVETCLTEMIPSLPDKYREAIEWAEQKELPQVELAARLNISYSGLKCRVQRARQMLKEKMEPLYNIKTDAYGNVIVCEDRVQCNCPGSEAQG